MASHPPPAVATLCGGDFGQSGPNPTRSRTNTDPDKYNLACCQRSNCAPLPGFEPVGLSEIGGSPCNLHPRWVPQSGGVGLEPPCREGATASPVGHACETPPGTGRDTGGENPTAQNTPAQREKGNPDGGHAAPTLLAQSATREGRAAPRPPGDPKPKEPPPTTQGTGRGGGRERGEGTSRMQ